MCKLQLVPADKLRHNVVEQAISTFKNHFLVILIGVDPSFPIHLWDRLILQSVLAQNFLCQLNVAPGISAYALLHGPLDYNAMLLALLGYAVQLHKATIKWKTWSGHSFDEWYLGTSKQYHREHTIYINKTKSVQNCNTVFFKHKYITHPIVTPADATVKACQELARTLQGRSTSLGRQIQNSSETSNDSHGVNACHNTWYIQCSTFTSEYLQDHSLSTKQNWRHNQGVHITGYVISRGGGSP